VFQIWVCLRKKGTANPLYIHWLIVIHSSFYIFPD
jgi:hypothetical protein